MKFGDRNIQYPRNFSRTCGQSVNHSANQFRPVILPETFQSAIKLVPVTEAERKQGEGSMKCDSTAYFMMHLELFCTGYTNSPSFRPSPGRFRDRVLS
jgi:hypothetical protein